MSDDCGQIRALAFLPFFRNKLKLPQPAEGRPQPAPGAPVERTQQMEAQRRAESDRQTKIVNSEKLVNVMNVNSDNLTSFRE